jgi:hypothetical protein
MVESCQRTSGGGHHMGDLVRERVAKMREQMRYFFLSIQG